MALRLLYLLRSSTTFRTILEEGNMSEENSTGSNMIWAITFIIIVAMLAGAVYYSGILGAKSKQEIDVDIKVPSAAR